MMIETNICFSDFPSLSAALFAAFPALKPSGDSVTNEQKISKLKEAVRKALEVERFCSKKPVQHFQ